MKYLLFVKKIEFAVSSFVLSLAAAHASECPSKLERIENSSLIAQCQFRRSLPAGRGQSVVYEDYSGRKFQNIKACVYGVLRSYGEQILFDAKLIDADAIFESNPSTAAAASLSDYRSFLNRDGTPIRLERDGLASWDRTQETVAIKTSGFNGNRRVGYLNYEDRVVYAEKNRTLTLEHRTVGFMAGKILYQFLFDCRVEMPIGTR